MWGDVACFCLHLCDLLFKREQNGSFKRPAYHTHGVGGGGDLPHHGLCGLLSHASNTFLLIHLFLYGHK